MTVREAVIRASGHIDRRDAETLLLHVLRHSRAWLLAHPESEVPPDLQGTFNGLADRRARHEPLQYLTGHQEFFGLDLQLTPDVLIPRPETEILVEAVLGWTRKAPISPGKLQIADIGTGSGAIALALATHLPAAMVTALDLSNAALLIAHANAGRLGLAGQIRFLLSDLLRALAPEIDTGLRLDAVVSNPPYVPVGDAPGMQPEVRDFEPHTALFAGPDGLAVYRRLIPQAVAALRPGGLLALEFGYGQREQLASLLNGWNRVQFLDDLAGIPRVALAERP